MQIGTVFASEEYVCPNAVGVDIGCGMCAVPVDGLHKDDLSLDDKLQLQRLIKVHGSVSKYSWLLTLQHWHVCAAVGFLMDMASEVCWCEQHALLLQQCGSSKPVLSTSLNQCCRPHRSAFQWALHPIRGFRRLSVCCWRR